MSQAQLRRIKAILSSASSLVSKAMVPGHAIGIARMKAFAIFVAAVLFGAALIVPCSAQTLQNDAAYQELLKLSDPSGVVTIDGKRYVRAPQGVNHLPGG